MKGLGPCVVAAPHVTVGETVSWMSAKDAWPYKWYLLSFRGVGLVNLSKQEPGPKHKTATRLPLSEPHAS